MAGYFDPEAMEGLPLPASPITSSGQDPDELREQMAQNAVRQGRALGAQKAMASPIGPTAPTQPVQPVQAVPAGPPSNVEPSGFNAETAAKAMTGQLTAGGKLADTADQEQPDPTIQTLQQKKMQDEAAAPSAADYKPGFGTRLLRGLRGAGMGLATHGIFGAAAGAIDPALTPGGKAYGAPTDAYDVALAKNQQQIGQDTEALGNAQTNFKTLEDMRKQRETGYKDAGEAFKGAGGTATTQEGEERQAAQLPIDQEKADTDKKKVYNEGPDGKLAITQGEIDQRTKLADAQHMPPGIMRTRYTLAGEIQPAREPGAEEIAVNRIVQSYRQQHQGQGPQTVQDWQSIYAAAKGGTGAAGGDTGKGMREAAGLAEKRVKDLETLMGSRGAALWDDKERASHQQDLDQARSEADDLRRQIAAPPGASPAAAGGGNPQPQAGKPPVWQQGTKDNTFSPDGQFVAMGGGYVKAVGQDGKVRMQLPDGRHARFTPDKAPQAAKMGAKFAGLQGQ